MPSPDASPKSPSLRDRHKLETRQALRDAALELFARQGYDTTTTEEICELAGVSPRTFFRHFATKDMVLFHGSIQWAQKFAAAYVDQPASVSEIDALAGSFALASSEVAGRRKFLILYKKAVASSMMLCGRAQDNHEADTAVVAAAIAARTNIAAPDARCTLLADVALTTFQQALDRWIAGPASTALEAAIAAEFEVLAHLFDPTGLTSQRRASRR